MKLAFFIVTKKIGLLQEISDRLLFVEKNISICPVCHGLKDKDVTSCTYCSGNGRDTHTICVIEEYADLLAIEQTSIFK
jgi:recombination protein RecR